MAYNWEELFAPDLGQPVGVSDALAHLNKGTPVIDQALPNLSGVDRAASGFVSNFLNPPNVPSMEVYGVRGGSVGARLGTPAPTGSPPTISPTVDPSTVDQNKFNAWYKNGVLGYGMHPDPNHADMNVNLYDKFTKGFTWGRDPSGMPALIGPDGKAEALTPNKYAMVTVPTAAPQPAGTPVAGAFSAPLPPSGPVVTQPGDAAPMLPAQAPVPGAPPMAVPGESTIGMPQSGPQVLSQTMNAQPNDVSGKIMQAAGMLASAADPRQFGQAGEMLAKLGTAEVTRERGNAAARLAGYPTVEAMEAAKVAVGMSETLQKTRLDKARETFMDVEAEVARQKIPGLQADVAKTMAETNLKSLELKYNQMTPPAPVNIQIGGTTITGMLRPKDMMDAGLAAFQAETSRYNALQAAQHNAALTQKLTRELNDARIPVSVPTAAGPQVAWFTNDEWLKYRQTVAVSTDRGEARKLAALNHQYDIIKAEKAAQLRPGEKLSPALTNSIEVYSNQLWTETDPFWKSQALRLRAMAGLPAPAGYTPGAEQQVGPGRVSSALSGGVQPVPPTSTAWQNQPVSRR